VDGEVLNPEAGTEQQPLLVAGWNSAGPVPMGRCYFQPSGLNEWRRCICQYTSVGGVSVKEFKAAPESHACR
jgi:hypothetical protein